MFRYLQRSTFERLSEQERRTLQEEFLELRPAAYRAALKGEVRVHSFVPLS